MKTLLFLLIIVISFIGCDPNSNGTNHDWYFEIIVDGGVPNRMEGTFNSCNYMSGYGYDESPLTCIVHLNSTYGIGGVQYMNGSTLINSVFVQSNDSNYVSGLGFDIQLDVLNLSLGLNYFGLREGNTYGSGIGVNSYNYGNGLFEIGGFSLTPMDTTHPIQNGKFPINITQTPSQRILNPNGCSDFGDPIIGSGSSTIYVLDTIDNPLNPWTERYRYRRPYHIEINFKTYTPLI
ncbi:hypothetical protein OAK19_05200 [Aureispira]|nr:hypothetical protein [Aureispira sp.]